MSLMTLLRAKPLPFAQHAKLVGALLLAGSGGCSSEYHPEFHPVSAYSYEQKISYPTTVFENAVPTTNRADPPNATTLSGRRIVPANVLILQTSHLDRPAEVVGVVDAHQEMGHHESALNVLRERAAALGADAVVGVEFHHGEGEGEPTHLSGLAVRFL
jgi:hypothetical protein